MSAGAIGERLANLEAVTDVRLNRLDVDDMLAEVLDRLCSAVDADTGAVLLVRQGSHELEARAAHGLEDEVRQGVRIPFGTGFAGKVAAQGEPVMLDQVDPTTVANPILWEKGIRRMLGVPLMYSDSVVGVLHVGRLEDRPFDGEDVKLLQVAGDRISTAVHLRQLAVEAAAARFLERGLLPGRLPQLPDLHFAARYVPGEEYPVGGDWYDTFVLPSGELWLVIGDVAGHGFNSAIVTSRVRSALRAYALLGDGPAQVLELTNRKLLHFETSTMVTVLCAVASPPYERFAICSAGHPPPVLAVADETRLVDLHPGPPLGAIDNATYTAGEVELPSDSTLVLYTDGLVERRGESIDEGLARLVAAVTNDAAEWVCRDVMHQLVGSSRTLDDIAVLAVHRALDRSSVAGDGLRHAATDEPGRPVPRPGDLAPVRARRRAGHPRPVDP